MEKYQDRRMTLSRGDKPSNGVPTVPKYRSSLHRRFSIYSDNLSEELCDNDLTPDTIIFISDSDSPDEDSEIIKTGDRVRKQSYRCEYEGSFAVVGEKKENWQQTRMQSNSRLLSANSTKKQLVSHPGNIGRPKNGTILKSSTANDTERSFNNNSENEQKISMNEKISETDKQINVTGCDDKVTIKNTSPDKYTSSNHYLNNTSKPSTSKADLSLTEVRDDLFNYEQTKFPLHFNDFHTAYDSKGKLMSEKASNTFHIQQDRIMECLRNLHLSLEQRPNLTVESQPKSLCVNLKAHQMEGLAWLVWREKEIPAGGVLADDMGLGKTLQMLALILRTSIAPNEKTTSHTCDFVKKIPPKRVLVGGTLVICPASVLYQWRTEIESKIRPGTLSLYIYHESKRIKNPNFISGFDVTLTTYGIIQKASLNDPLKTIKWHRIILDEAHIIRNHTSQTAQSVFELRSEKKWVVTGTPIHNRSQDYYAFIKFLNVEPFNNLSIWKKFVSNGDKSGVERLSVINSSIMLRRTKEEICKIDQSCGLTNKDVRSIVFSLQPEELSLYEDIAKFSTSLFTEYMTNKMGKNSAANQNLGSEKSQFHVIHEEMIKNHPDIMRKDGTFFIDGDVKSYHIFVLLLRLQQICCHPSLIRGALDMSDLSADELQKSSPNDPTRTVELMPTFSSSKNNLFQECHSSSKIEAVISCLTNIFENFPRDKIVIVSQWTSFLGIVEKFIGTRLEEECVSLNGKVPVNRRQEIIKYFNSSEFIHRILLLSLKAGGVGLNLVGGNHLLFIDLHWNPQLEIQASDRIHRIGQSKDVYIYKFVCQNTIEERILQLQRIKLSMAVEIIGGSVKPENGSDKLTMDDLKLLFGIDRSVPC